MPLQLGINWLMGPLKLNTKAKHPGNLSASEVLASIWWTSGSGGIK